MSVVVRVPAALAADTGGVRDLEFNVAADATLDDLLEQVRLRHPALGRRVCDETGSIRRFVNIYVGDDECRSLQGRATPVPAGAVVFIVGSVAGG